MSKFTPPPQSRRSSIEQQTEAEALFTSIGDGAISTDEFGRITRVNPVAQGILGFSESELVGEWFPNKIIAVNANNKTLSLIDRPITKTFLTGRPVSQKMFYRRKNGQMVPVAATVSPILHDGKPLGAVQVFRDITFEEEVDRMKSEFISLASHQLRTPLSAIKTYSHMLVDGFMGEITPTQKKSLRTIIKGADRMNELISNLLNITRIESGTIVVTPKRVYIEKIIDEVVQEVSIMANDKSIKLRVKPHAGGSITIRTDALIFKEIIINLVSNAIKYTPEGGAVTIATKRRAKDILIEISDTGWGIPAQSQDQIFSKFFRAPNIVVRETTGTGLGLYLVKGLVDTLGGTIRFTSREGVGTSFFLKIKQNNKSPLPKTTKSA